MMEKEIDWKVQALALADAGNKLADELSLIEASQGVNRSASDALSEWDAAAIFVRLNK